MADKDTKIAAMMMSALMLTDDADLADFRRKRIGRDATVDLAHIGRVRDLLLVLAEAVKRDDAATAAQVRAVATLLLGTADAAPEATPPAAATEPAAELAAALPADEAPRADSSPSPPPSVHVKPASEAPAADEPAAPLRVGEAVPEGPLSGALAAKLAQPSPWVVATAAAGRAAPGPSPWTAPMPVEQYAALCALSAVFPERLPDTHARFGLRDPEGRQELDRLWYERFRADPQAHALWGMLFSCCRQWLTVYGRLPL